MKKAFEGQASSSSSTKSQDEPINSVGIEAKTHSPSNQKFSHLASIMKCKSVKIAKHLNKVFCPSDFQIIENGERTAAKSNPVSIDERKQSSVEDMETPSNIKKIPAHSLFPQSYDDITEAIISRLANQSMTKKSETTNPRMHYTGPVPYELALELRGIPLQNQKHWNKYVGTPTYVLPRNIDEVPDFLLLRMKNRGVDYCNQRDSQE